MNYYIIVMAVLLVMGLDVSDGRADELDVSRFLGLHNNRRFLIDRIREVPGMHYGLPYPFHEFTTGRSLRMSPIFPALQAQGAVFGQTIAFVEMSENIQAFENVRSQINYLVEDDVLNDEGRGGPLNSSEC